jgi:alanine dehydrogenase
MLAYRRGHPPVTILLAAHDLERLLTTEVAIRAAETAFRAYSSGAAESPLRAVVSPPGAEGVLLAMPGSLASAEAEALGAKIVTVYAGNAARGLPTLLSLYVLCDFRTGLPLAVMDGTYLTAVRTAAGSAVATAALAGREAGTLGVFGTGTQARHHVRSILAVRPIRRVLVAGRTPEQGRVFAAWVRREVGVPAQGAPHGRASGAEILAVCTTSPHPVVDAARVRPGAHVNAIGAFTPATRELPTALVERGEVYVDSRSGAFNEAGDLLIPVAEGRFSLDRVRGELGEVLLGRAPGRRDAGAVTIYKSVGGAFMDAAVAKAAYDLARDGGVGQEFSF